MCALRSRLSIPLALATLLLLVAATNEQPETALPAISRADPALMLQEATDRLLAVSRAAQSYADNDRERYYSEVTQVLEQVVDIQFFARSVMATYASSRLYQSLKTDAERAALRDRLARFEIQLKRVWMVAYADALLTYKSASIELTEIPGSNDRKDRMAMRQTIHHEDGQTYVIQYTLHTIKDGSWRICNVIIEDVNLGLIYRNQFAEAVENHKGDVDYVVDHWVEIMLHEEYSDTSDQTATAK